MTLYIVDYPIRFDIEDLILGEASVYVSCRESEQVSRRRVIDHGNSQSFKGLFRTILSRCNEMVPMPGPNYAIVHFPCAATEKRRLRY